MPPDEPSEREIPMAGKHTAAPNSRTKTPAAASASLLPSPSPAAELNRANGPFEPTDAFAPHRTLTKLSTGKSSQAYLAEESVFMQGDAADAVFYIESGSVKLTVVSKSGKEAVVAILPQGSFFGEGCLAGQPLRMAMASTNQKSLIIRIEKQAMIAFLHREPEFSERFLAYLLSRNIRMEADLVDHLFNSSEKRLARLLLLMANFGQESKPIPLIAKMSQETLAEMIGTTRSRVSFFMNRFREMGFIEYNCGRVNVHSSLISIVLHD
jgi:CRP/FNR family cyclic AMP-dependent transcriptional regulator